MSLHVIDLSGRLDRFLDRREPHRRFNGDDKAQAAREEVKALVSCLERNSPRTDVAEWWPAFEARLGEVCPIYWPTEKDIRDVAREVHPKPAAQVRALDAKDRETNDLELWGKQIRDRQAVSDRIIYGRTANLLLEGGHCSFSDLEPYRRAAFHVRKAAYGDEVALRWQNEQIAGVMRGPVDGVSRGGGQRMPLSSLDDVPGTTGADLVGADLDQLRRARAANPIVQAARASQRQEEQDLDDWRRELEHATDEEDRP